MTKPPIIPILLGRSEKSIKEVKSEKSKKFPQVPQEYTSSHALFPIALDSGCDIPLSPASARHQANGPFPHSASCRLKKGQGIIVPGMYVECWEERDIQEQEEAELTTIKPELLLSPQKSQGQWGH